MVTALIIANFVDILILVRSEIDVGISHYCMLLLEILDYHT